MHASAGRGFRGEAPRLAPETLEGGKDEYRTCHVLLSRSRSGGGLAQVYIGASLGFPRSGVVRESFCVCCTVKSLDIKYRRVDGKGECFNEGKPGGLTGGYDCPYVTVCSVCFMRGAVYWDIRRVIRINGCRHTYVHWFRKTKFIRRANIRFMKQVPFKTL